MMPDSEYFSSILRHYFRVVASYTNWQPDSDFDAEMEEAIDYVRGLEKRIETLAADLERHERLHRIGVEAKEWIEERNEE